MWSYVMIISLSWCSFKATRSNCLATRVSINFSYKQIILESCRLLPIYTCRFRFPFNDQKSEHVLKKGTVWFVPQLSVFIQHASILNKLNLWKIIEKNACLFFISENIMTFIHSDVKVLIQSYPPQVFVCGETFYEQLLYTTFSLKYGLTDRENYCKVHYYIHSQYNHH